MKRLAALMFLLLSAGPAMASADLGFYDGPRIVPKVAFQDGQGRKLTLDDFKGKLVVLDFWATWCGPCRTEFPALDRLQEKLGDKGLVVVPVSIDRKGMLAVDRFYDEMKPAHLGRFLDDERTMSDAFGIRALPTTVIIDRQGGEIARVEGAADWDSPKLQAELLKRMAK
ncbi:MAG TPA: TlpA disulfide reductase family protein [Candidatus Sulfotelmatobacter sp.]|jgi:thiol-disulfide isomerase/thioredoxin|nr:TlpA disulfide reductase family protein [Candidatus Sulfotelmatobacter sp.]